MSDEKGKERAAVEVNPLSELLREERWRAEKLELDVAMLRQEIECLKARYRGLETGVELVLGQIGVLHQT